MAGSLDDIMFRKKSWPRILLGIGLLSVLAILPLYFFCDECFSSAGRFFKAFVFSLATWVSLWKGNTYLSCLLDLKISWVKFPVKRLIAGLVATTVYTTLMVYLLILVYQLAFNYNWPAESILSNIKTSLLITFIISTIMHARSFLINWKKSELDAEKIKTKACPPGTNHSKTRSTRIFFLILSTRLPI